MSEYLYLEIDSIMEDGMSEYAVLHPIWADDAIMKSYNSKAELPYDNKVTKCMWNNQPYSGGKLTNTVADFTGFFRYNSYLQEGLVTRRDIAEELTSRFSGLLYKEIEWVKNPLEDYSKPNKPRTKKPKWLPTEEVDLVHIYSMNYIEKSDIKSGNVPYDFFMVKNLHTLVINSTVIDYLQSKKYTGIKLRKLPF